jgi:hypothetical protein
MNEKGRYSRQGSVARSCCKSVVTALNFEQLWPGVRRREAHLVRFERFPNCGHSVIADAPHHAFAIIRASSDTDPVQKRRVETQRQAGIKDKTQDLGAAGKLATIPRDCSTGANSSILAAMPATGGTAPRL